ncbi:MAG: SufD family Fe-S cluster assembly protein [Candidatus Hydrothermales bacterium]
MLPDLKIKNKNFLRKREEIFNNLSKLDLPNERYTDLRNLPFEKYLKIRDNTFIKDNLSDEEGVIFFPDFFDNETACEILLKTFNSNKNRILAANLLFPTGGFFLEIKNREKVLDLNLLSPSDFTYSLQTYIFKLSNSFLELNINQENEGDFFSHSLFIFIVEDGSKLKLYNFNAPNVSFLFSSFYIYLSKDTESEIYSAYFKNPYSKIDKRVFIEGTGARALIRDIFVADKNLFLSLRNDLIFKESYTSGEEYTRGVLFDESTVCFYGLARVEEKLKKINAFVEGEALLLSERGSFLPVPSLEILSNDLRCTHSVNSGPLSEEKLFYMISRGLERKEAIRMYIESYLLSNLDGSKEEFKNRIRKYLDSYEL